ncbi:MAG: peptidylprolyl isomerase [Candidatus Aminicenantes bacterium]|nr:peptidylprolyl isomerase [Candidatus Aminicenantes bacterium]
MAESGIIPASRDNIMKNSPTGGILASALTAAAIFWAGGCQESKHPNGLYAEVATNKGLIVLQLEFEKTPMTAANFVGLAEGTIENVAFPLGTPYFDGVAWHRVVPGHVIQCGIPKSGKAKDPGYQFPNEIVLPDLNHGRAGMVNMANGGPHTNGSQWCITLGDRSYLDGDYTVFGQVVEGLDVVMSVVQGDLVQKVKIVRIGPKARAFKPTTASFKAMVEEAKIRVQKAEEEKKAEEDALVQANWPDAVEGENGVKYKILKSGRGEPPLPGATVKAAYTGQAPLAGKTFVSTAEDGMPYWGETPEPFAFVVETTRVNPAVDAALAAMKKGEKRLLVVPAGQGYRRSGFYAAQRPGEKRFVISPDTLLVYEIEILDIIYPPNK